MDVTTINQLIETCGLLLIAGFAYCTFRVLTARKKNIENEISLNKDMLFYYYLVGIYKVKLDELEDDIIHKNIKDELIDEFGHKPSGNHTPSSIARRLEQLGAHSKKLDDFLSRSKIV